jgi:hypothetical protein
MGRTTLTYRVFLQMAVGTGAGWGGREGMRASETTLSRTCNHIQIALLIQLGWGWCNDGHFRYNLFSLNKLKSIFCVP